MDLYAVIVRKGFRNTSDDPWAHKKLIEHVKACGVCGSVPDGLAQAAISQNLPSQDTMLLRRLRL